MHQKESTKFSRQQFRRIMDFKLPPWYLVIAEKLAICMPQFMSLSQKVYFHASTKRITAIMSALPKNILRHWRPSYAKPLAWSNRKKCQSSFGRSPSAIQGCSSQHCTARHAKCHLWVFEVTPVQPVVCRQLPDDRFYDLSAFERLLFFIP